MNVSEHQPEVLFVCKHNAGRSQMAAGLVKLRSRGRIHVRSAGSNPGEEINRAVVRGARQEKLEDGAKLRIDSTVTKALMHAPTDSSLLGMRCA